MILKFGILPFVLNLEDRYVFLTFFVLNQILYDFASLLF